MRLIIVMILRVRKTRHELQTLRVKETSTTYGTAAVRKQPVMQVDYSSSSCFTPPFVPKNQSGKARTESKTMIEEPLPFSATLTPL